MIATGNHWYLLRCALQQPLRAAVRRPTSPYTGEALVRCKTANMHYTERCIEVRPLSVRQIGIYISAKTVNIFLELLDEQANMISVTDSVMYLYCKWKHAFTFPIKVFSHCENRQQEMSVIKNVYVEPRKLHPRHHGYIKRVGRSAVLGCITR